MQTHLYPLAAYSTEEGGGRAAGGIPRILRGSMSRPIDSIAGRFVFNGRSAEEGASELDTRAPVSLYIAAPDFPHDRSSVREAKAPRRAPILPHSRAERPSLRLVLLAPFIRSGIGSPAHRVRIN